MVGFPGDFVGSGGGEGGVDMYGRAADPSTHGKDKARRHIECVHNITIESVSSAAM